MIPALLVTVATASTSVDAQDCADIYNGAIVCVEKARAYKRRVSELEIELATREGAAEDNYSLGTVIVVAICAAALGAGVGAVAAVAAAH